MFKDCDSGYKSGVYPYLRRFRMKKVLVSILILMLLSATTVFAGGGKAQGEDGLGGVNQGTGGFGISPGYDAQDNMVD